MLLPVKLIGRAASTAVHTVRHPISSVAYAAGIARGLAEAVLPGSLTQDHVGSAPVPQQRTAPEPRAETREPEAPAGPRKPQVVPKPVPPPDAEFDTIVIEAADEEPGEAFATEPKAVSKESAHGGPTTTDAEVDAWEDDARDDDAPDPVDTVVNEPLTEPVLDPGTVKAIRKETETLRKAAEREPE